ncbi:DUF760 domain-containing protein [Oxynema sp. CENA135]|uniref:DUF760 domain-containing protein n=1 Tax=Oxynema sp. CENA135 TaxID=984206 RepID=UPI00190C3FC8|nr:DUF760 domain-containing protein [Oxynema sp. CENA135]
MKEPISNRPDFFDGASETSNLLWKYVQSLNPDTIAQLSQPSSSAAQVMERNLKGILGGLPGDRFDVSVTTNRDTLGQLLASAMMSGYFLRNAEQRMALEQSLQLTGHSEES